MRIRRLEVENFKGIKTLSWAIRGTTVCLIGPNNATKTTILQAIEAVLSPKWNATFNDTDFYNCDVEQNISISVVISDLPKNLIAIDKFGEYLRGWDAQDGLIDEPKADSETVISIRLIVDNTLEPIWEVYCDRGEKRISANDRRELGLAYVTASVDRDFSWGKGSPLTRVTEDGNQLNLSEINRKARQAIEGATISSLEKASKNVQDLSKPYGIKPKHDFKPAFDPDSFSINNGTLSIHDGNIPLRQYGLGSKRLVSLAMQRSMTKHGAIVLIDEIEHGLEPYRLRQLVRLLRPPTSNNNDNHAAQVIMTSHSTVTVVELKAEELYVTRSEDGITTVTQVSSDLQDLVRIVPEALLCPRVIICEGKTEVGLLRAMDRFWASTTDGENLAFHGVSLADGGGNSNAHSKTIEFIKLGYDAMLFVDSDDIDFNKKVEKCKQDGIKVVIWDGDKNTEERLFLDLPLPKILEIVDCAIANRGEESVFDALTNDLSKKIGDKTALEELFNTAENRTRLTLGKTASAKDKKGGDKKAWFKRTDLAEEIGDIVARVLDDIQETDLAIKLDEIRSWVYQQ